MPINRLKDKEAVVCIYNGVLLSHKKECIWVSSSEVNESRAYYTEWSKSEREKQILHINTDMESRKMVLMNLSAGQQRRRREQTCAHSGEGEGGTTRESSTDTYTLLYVKQITVGICCMMQGAQTLLCDNLNGWDRVGVVSLLWGHYSFPLGPGMNSFVPSKSLCFSVSSAHLTEGSDG